MSLSGEVLISEAALRGRLAAMANEIAADTPAGTALSVLTIMDGAFAFAADLVRLLPMPVRLAFSAVQSVSRGGDPGKVVLPAEFPVEGVDLLVVEDILDTGRTLSALRDRLSMRAPSRIRIAVLLDKPSRREVDIRPDYVGFTVPDVWVVGYGLDAEGLYRNLPYITYIEPTGIGSDGAPGPRSL